MRVIVSGRHIDVGAALRQHAEAAIAAAVAKYFDRAQEGHVTFGKRGAFFHADLTVHVGRGIDAQASAEADDAYRAFDVALEHLTKRLRRNKRRLRDHHNDKARQIEAEAARYAVLRGPEHEEDAAEEAPGPAEPVVVAETQAEIATLSVSQAVLRLDLSGAPALLFRNAAHGGYNMIYRRNDGHIGWVDPRNAR